MTVEDRERLILEFFDEKDVALPLRPLYVNLKRSKSITFSKRTVKRRVDELVDRGYLRQLDIGNGYYEITDEGQAYLRDL